MICGLALVQTPVFYDYHLNLCDRFLDRVCYSDKSVFLIFLERTTGNALVLLLLLAGGIHPAALLLPSAVLCYRAYTFGGTLAVLFSVYRAAGALVAFVLYLPVHLALDAIFLLAATLSASRAFCFRFLFCDFKELFTDFLFLLLAVALVCFLEMLLLGVLFHPIGNLL